MRVIAGKCRGMRLYAPSGRETRPTSDRIKESLFSILDSRMDFDGLQVLDICAGTGSLGIEALSRGSAFCVFIEHARGVIPVLERNLRQARLSEQADLIRQDAVSAVRLLGLRQARFDLVFFDPPYSSNLYVAIPGMLLANGLLNPGAVLVVERAARSAALPQPAPFAAPDSRTYGDTTLDLFSMEA